MTTGLKTREVFHQRPRGLRAGEREVDAPAFIGQRLRAAAVAGLAGGGAYLATLVVVALARGRSALYPLRAVYAIFNGNRYLPEHAIFPLDYGTFEVAKSLVWIVSLGVIFALPLALFAPGRVLSRGRLGLWLALGTGWSLLVFAVAFGALGNPSDQVQRYAFSFQGARDLGVWAFGLAHLAYGLVIGRLLCGRTRTRVVVRPH